jgi:hypothetical protein
MASANIWNRGQSGTNVNNRKRLSSVFLLMKLYWIQQKQIVKMLKTEKTMVASGNHGISICPW